MAKKTPKKPATSGVAVDVETTSAASSGSEAEVRRPKKKRCWPFGKKSGKIWTTRQMSGKESREKEVQISLRELIIYIIFLISLLILSVGMTDQTRYYYTKVMTDLFVHSEFTVDGRAVTFRSSKLIADFWKYAETAMADGFYWDFWYKHSDAVPEAKQDANKKEVYENRVLGVPRLRQVRVRNQSCVVHSEFRSSFKQCYDFYNPQSEDKEPFGPPDVEGTAWIYTDEDEINGLSYQGLVPDTSTYGGGGYYVDLTPTYEGSVELIKSLRKNLWIDRGTRAVFVDFTVYNANVNLFCVVKLVLEIPPTGGVIPSSSFRTLKLLRYVSTWDYVVLGVELVLEIPPTGGVIPSSSFRTLKLLRYVSTWDYVVLGVEFVFVVFIIFYTLEELREMIFFKWQYFTFMWNLLDMVILLISYTCIVFSVYRYEKVAEKVKSLSKDQRHYVDFTTLARWQIYYNSAVAILVFFCWIKIFKYISFNRTLSQLSNTLSRCAGDVAGFGVMFCIVFVAFAELGYLLFGTQVEGFSSFKDSVFSLLRTILGDFDYPAIEKANRVLGPLFFLMYIFFVFFVLLNMFLAIINDTYSEVKSEITTRHNDLEVFDFVARGYHNIMNKICCKKKAAASSETEPLTQEDIRALLRKSNFTDLEIEMFFAKYDIDKTKMISKEEAMNLLQDMDAKERAGDASKRGSNTAPQGVTPKEYKDLDARVKQIETQIGVISDKVDLIVKTLEEELQAEKK